MAASFFSITTLKDDGTDDVPYLWLHGRALPYQGYELEGTMRAEFTWYPGNAVATVQMLGAQEKSSTIKGMWKDRFIKSVTDDGIAVTAPGVALYNGTQVTDVLDLVKKVDDMRLQGKLLAVEWCGILRHGILTRFKQSWLRIEDMEWEMEFQWVSHGKVQTPPSIPIRPDVTGFASNVQALVNTLKSVVEAVKEGFEVVESWSNKVNAAIKEIDTAATEMTNAAANAQALIFSPLNTTQRALAASESIKNSAQTIVNVCQGTPPYQVIKANIVTPPTTGASTATVAPATTLDLATGLKADAYTRNVKAAARDLQLTASSEGDDLRASLEQDTLLAAFVARGPMDLRDVSQKYYGTPNEWRRLLSYNNLDSSQLDAGVLVLVPKLNGADERT